MCATQNMDVTHLKMKSISIGYEQNARELTTEWKL